MNFKDKLEELGTFWEKIDFPNGVTVGPGRSKKGLWKDHIGYYFDPGMFKNKTILDIGCNAGGNLIKLSKFHPKKLVGVDYSGTYCKQARFVCDQFNVDAEIIQYAFDGTKPYNTIAEELGDFDYIFCLGVIYHQKLEAFESMIEYIRRNSKRSFYSTQTIDAGGNRSKIDWDVSEKGTIEIFEKCGFSDIKDIYRKSPEDNWASLTNDWYFEAKHS